jgi:hypothetical protein
MNSIDIEIQQLQSRIAELEKIKKESFKLDEKALIDYKFEKLKNLVIKKEEHINESKRTNSHKFGRYYDDEIYIHSKASYDLFRIFNKRLDKLETLAQKYKEKLI